MFYSLQSCIKSRLISGPMHKHISMIIYQIMLPLLWWFNSISPLLGHPPFSLSPSQNNYLSFWQSGNHSFYLFCKHLDITNTSLCCSLKIHLHTSLPCYCERRERRVRKHPAWRHFWFIPFLSLYSGQINVER